MSQKALPSVLLHESEVTYRDTGVSINSSTLICINALYGWIKSTRFDSIIIQEQWHYKMIVYFSREANINVLHKTDRVERTKIVPKCKWKIYLNLSDILCI